MDFDMDDDAAVADYIQNMKLSESNDESVFTCNDSGDDGILSVVVNRKRQVCAK